MSTLNSSRALARALHDALRIDAGIMAQLGSPARLYDHAPEDPVFPYLTYGAMRREDQGGDGSALLAHTINLHVWSRYGGRAEILDAVHALEAVFERRDIEVAGFDLVTANVVYSDIFRAADGRTLHGILRVAMKLAPLNTYAAVGEAA